MDLDDAELETQLRETLQRAAAPVHGEGVFKEAIRNEVARRQASRDRARWTGRIFLATAVAAAAAVAAFVLINPGESDVKTDDGPVATQPTAPPTTEAAPTTTEAPSTTPSTTATPAPDTGSGDGGQGQAGPGTTVPTTPALPEFPPEHPLEHGANVWGVYLDVEPAGQDSTPEFVAGIQSIKDAGYTSAGEGYSGIGCDDGAAETLGVSPDSISPAVYFDTQEQANQAKAAFEARGQHVDGIAHVTTYCLD
jgi:hypothetical protein